MTSLSKPDCECTEDSFEYGCQECCEHDFDPGEGFTCLNCGAQGEPIDVHGEYEAHE